MMRRAGNALGLAVLLSTAACAGAATGGARSVGDAERVRAGLIDKDVAALAPQIFAAANQEVELAKQAQAAGDDTSAALRGDRALALYNQAIAVARLARAAREDADASEALVKANEQAQRYAAQRKTVDHQADDLEKKLRVAREAQLPPSSGPAEPERERARAIAAQALVSQARLLCGAARLVSPTAPGLAEAEAAVGALEKQADTAKLGIDPAARARAACLGSLTRARRAAGGADLDPSDTLLSELSQSGDPKGPRHDLAPARDERGVVVTMRSAFRGEKLTPEAEAALKDLGRVAAAHPTFAVQVVVHDATAPAAAEIVTNQKRGEAIVQALVGSGAAAAKMKVEQAGAKAPVVDPKDTRHRDRNARVEVVFVSSGS